MTTTMSRRKCTEVISDDRFESVKRPRFEGLGSQSEETFDQGRAEHEEDRSTNQRHSDSNVCIGMIEGGVLLITRSAREDLPFTRHGVELISFQQGIAVHDKPKSTYLGLLHGDIGSKLAELLSTLTLTAEAYLCAWQPVHKGDQPAARSVDILLYAYRQDSDMVGDHLASKGIYLQHPRMACELNTPYYNPQYLLGPQESFPTLTEFQRRLALQEDSPGAQDAANDTGLAKTLFNYAQGPTEWKMQNQSSRLTSMLHSHQLKAMAMMLEKERGLRDDPDFPPLWRKVSQISPTRAVYRNVVNGLTQENPYVALGGLLADDMGLGKTLTTIALIAAALDQLQESVGVAGDEQDTNLDSFGVSKTLIIAPRATIANWEKEFDIHTKPGSIKLCVYQGRARNKLAKSLQECDVVLTTYGILEKDSDQSEKSQPNPTSLFSTQWLRVIFDEAHVLRNNKTKMFEAASGLSAERIWCLTGTPIQNYIEDLGALLQILQVAPFHDPSTFAFEFGQLGKTRDERALIKLRRLISATCLRRTKEILDLPSRTDIKVEISLNRSEQALYNTFSARLMTSIDEVLKTGMKPNAYANIMKHILRLRQICDHGAELLPSELLLTTGPGTALTDATLPACEICSADISRKLVEFECMHVVCTNCIAAVLREQPEVNDNCPMCCAVAGDVSRPVANSRTHSTVQHIDFQALRPSSKVSQLLKNLMFEKHSTNATMKSVVFSEWTTMLDLVGLSLKARQMTFTRIDGQIKPSEWKKSFETFAKDPQCNVLLASLRNAGVGIDLRVAQSVHLLEPQWNPMVEEQAFDRVHRLGQKHPVRMYRYIIKDSIEEYVQQKKQHKLELIRASLDAHQDNKKLTFKDKLTELKQFFHIKAPIEDASSGGDAVTSS